MEKEQLRNLTIPNFTVNPTIISCVGSVCYDFDEDNWIEIVPDFRSPDKYVIVNYVVDASTIGTMVVPDGEDLGKAIVHYAPPEIKELFL